MCLVFIKFNNHLVWNALRETIILYQNKSDTITVKTNGPILFNNFYLSFQAFRKTRISLCLSKNHSIRNKNYISTEFFHKTIKEVWMLKERKNSESRFSWLYGFPFYFLIRVTFTMKNFFCLQWKSSSF